ncbi:MULTISPECIES: hypothetical protein [unclassified Curtobacterium]|nr:MULTISPECIES: hypothetical protein [unclassified Curtobacterium]WIE66241.1 hypothetical protein DEI99_006825 [Curtobacterium sp. MCLR17_036]
MIVDGISDANRGTWSRLTRLHTASVGLPMHTTRVEATAPTPDVRNAA